MTSDEWTVAFIRGVTRIPPSRAYRHRVTRLEPVLTDAQRRLLEFLKHRIAEGKVSEFPEGQA